MSRKIGGLNYKFTYETAVVQNNLHIQFDLGLFCLLTEWLYTAEMKGNLDTFNGDNSFKIIFVSLKKALSKRKEFAPLRAKSFLLE